MKVDFYYTHSFEREAFERANMLHKHEIQFFGPRLSDVTRQLLH